MTASSPAEPNAVDDGNSLSDERAGRALLMATHAYEHDSPARSAWLVASTVLLLILALAGAGWTSHWATRVVCSLLGALLMVRLFITYHDYMHGAILRNSRLANAFFQLYGCLALTPARAWCKSHNFHHGHVGQLSRTSDGAFPLITAQMWRDASRATRLKYRASRHPLILVFGYITVFGYSICLEPLLRDPRHHWDSALSLLAHGGLLALAWTLGGFETAFFVMLLPMAVASLLGSYLFFAQHAFKRMKILSGPSWSFYRAALQSSSYMKLNRLLRWFTGNIGYHHIHHLNVRIPFYRLPEAMAGIRALQSPVTITLAPRDILDCFRACLWDDVRQRMVSYREADALAA